MSKALMYLYAVTFQSSSLSAGSRDKHQVYAPVRAQPRRAGSSVAGTGPTELRPGPTELRLAGW